MNRNDSTLLLLTAAAILLGQSALHAQPWYQTEKAKCDTVAADLPTMEMINAIFPRELPIAGSPMTVLYMNWPAADYRRIQGSRNHSDIRRQYTLNARDRDNLRRQFTQLGSGAKLPWYVNAATAAATWMISDTLGRNIFRVVKTVFRGVMDEANGRELTALEMAAVFAEGGVLKEVMTADEPAPGKPYISDAVIYQVKVGNEMRNYTILSCTYAVNLQ